MSATVIVGAQWGSEGKGVVSAALAGGFDVAVRVGGPNAGHSFRRDGRTFKMRSVPCAWVNPLCELIIGAGAVVDPDLLARELNDLPGKVRIVVDSNATVVTHQDAVAEHDAHLWEAIGSTTEGVGLARYHKMARDVSRYRPLARHVDEWHPSVRLEPDTAGMLADYLRSGDRVMLEGTQGSGLSLHHGTQWPFVTSADVNASGMLSDAGIAPSHVGHVFLVARTLPIRVAGNSGPMGDEIGWAALQTFAHIENPERTTVTDRVRRISKWHDGVFARAVQINDPCGVFLMFADYLVPGMAGTDDAGALLDAAGPTPFGDLRQLTQVIEDIYHVPIVAYGTGGRGWELAFRGSCRHGDSWDASPRLVGTPFA